MDPDLPSLRRRKRGSKKLKAASSGFVDVHTTGKGISCFLQSVKNTPSFKNDRAEDQKQDGRKRSRVRSSRKRRGSVLSAVAWPGMELDTSDIEGYTDTSSHSSPEREAPVSTHRPSSSLSRYISGVWHSSAGDLPAAEAITDYDSSPSPASPQAPSLLPHRHGSHPLTEEDIISSGPSSQEASPTSSPLLKTSDWLKQSIQETPSTAVDTSVSESVLLSSGLKGNKRRGVRLVAGGMAEQLQRVIQRETADIAFWEHQAKRKEITEPCVIVEVLTVSSMCSLLLANCRVREGQQLLIDDQCCTQQQDVEDEMEVMVYFDVSIARQLRLTVGCIIRIHSPWQKLLLTDGTTPLPVLLCTHYSELMGHTSSSPSLLLSPGPLTSKFASNQFSDTILSPSSAMLSRSPVKSMQPSRLFATSSPKQSSAPPTIPSQRGVLEALEQCQRGSVSFTATVRAVYRRPLPSSSISSRHCSENAVCWWVVLLQDDHGVCAELVICEEHLSTWTNIVSNGEGKRLDITGLRVVRRITASRDPELFSLIHTLSWSSPDDASISPVMTSSAQYSFCYVCYTQQNSSYQIISSSEDSSCEASGISESILRPSSISGRVLLLHPNPGHYPDTISSSSGYTLLLVSVAIGNVSHSTDQVVSVHIKPSFPITGLLKVLSSPGEIVLLKNVLPLTKLNNDSNYTMGPHSQLVPMNRAHLNGVWPCFSCNLDEKRKLSQLCPPVCPWFDPASEPGCLVQAAGAIVSVDQSTAYSWLECNACGQSDLVSMNMSQCYTCETCQRTVHDPATRVRLAVILSSTLHPSWEYHVQLAQTTILSLLPETAGSFDEGFNINCVLQHQLSLPVCFVTKKAVNPHGCSTVFLIEVDTRWSSE